MRAMTKRVLIIEDDPACRRVLARLLRSVDQQVELDVADDAMMAMRLIGEAPYDLVLFDIGLPVIDGIEVARILQRSPTFAKAEFVAVSGRDTPRQRARAAAVGVSSWMPKPFGRADVAAVIGVAA